MNHKIIKLAGLALVKACLLHLFIFLGDPIIVLSIQLPYQFFLFSCSIVLRTISILPSPYHKLAVLLSFLNSFKKHQQPLIQTQVPLYDIT